MNSNHKCEVVRLGAPLRHENADTLEIFKVFDWNVVSKQGTWKENDLVAYVVPDSLVPTDRPEFSFLKATHGIDHRVKVIRLRGVYSQGLVVPAPVGSVIGADVAEILGVRRYVPPEPLSSGGEDDVSPSGFVPKYDLESFNRYAKDIFRDGEPVVVTEKIHGANGRWTWRDGRLHCGSRTSWKKQDQKSIWWKAAEKYPQVEEFLKAYPSFVLFGEVFGQVQDLKYGRTGVDLACFDIMRPDGRYMDHDEAFHLMLDFKIQPVPVICDDAIFDRQVLLGYAEGKSLVDGANNVREGCVIRPAIERIDPVHGRAVLKIVGNGYLERA